MLQIGISEDRWDESIEIEAVLRRPYAIARIVEHDRSVTGAQGIQMIRQWQSSLHAPINVLAFPKSARLKHRKRELLEVRPRASCHQGTQVFQDVCWDQVEDRLFTIMPSKTRMVQLYMSKQMPMDCIADVMPAEWIPTAKTFYVAALRKAAAIHDTNCKKVGPQSATRPTKKPKRSRGLSMVDLFGCPGADDAEPDLTGAQAEGCDDPVLREMEVWRDLDPAKYGISRGESGLLNEFELVCKAKEHVPLHYTAFRKVASHLPHEGNVEQLFSLAKHTNDCNMKAMFLRLLTKIRANKSLYKPSSKRIWDKYCQKFRGCRNNFSDASSSDGSDSSSDCEP